MTTGLHALHVIAGALFLAIALYRMVKDSFTTEHHLGLEKAAAYWHLVDVVWLALFLLLFYLKSVFIILLISLVIVIGAISSLYCLFHMPFALLLLLALLPLTPVMLHGMGQMV